MGTLCSHVFCKSKIVLKNPLSKRKVLGLLRGQQIAAFNKSTGRVCAGWQDMGRGQGRWGRTLGVASRNTSSAPQTATTSPERALR